jgi:hypothetical protein
MTRYLAILPTAVAVIAFSAAGVLAQGGPGNNPADPAWTETGSTDYMGQSDKEASELPQGAQDSEGTRTETTYTLGQGNAPHTKEETTDQPGARR